jgi:diguanylate cyclase (GGDEF)-like protein
MGNLTLIRGALASGFAFGLAMLALDYWVTVPGFDGWSTVVRSAITHALVLVLFYATFDRDATDFLPRLAIAVGLSIAATFLLIGAFAPGEPLSASFIGYVVITFYVYFFLGQRFWYALMTAAALFASFVAAGIVHHHTQDVIIYGTYLLFINMISAVFLYNYESNRRQLFWECKAVNDLARRDSLTGLVNRKGLDEHLSDIWAHAKREKQPLALALIDIDHFKAYNDHKGHQAGDRCLAAVAEVIGKAARRPLDLAARFGGEEFVLVLFGTSLEDAEKITDNLRRQIIFLNLPHPASPTAAHVTVSAGLVHLYPHSTTRSIEGAIQLADEAVYAAKHRGRNRVSVAGIEADKNMQTGVFRMQNAASNSAGG